MSKARGSGNNKKSTSTDPYKRLAQSLNLDKNNQRTSTHPDFQDFRGAIYDLKGEILHPALPYRSQSTTGTAQSSTNPEECMSVMSSNGTQTVATSLDSSGSISVPRESPRLSLEETLKRRLSRTSFGPEDIDQREISPSVGRAKTSVAESKKRMQDIALRFKAKRVKHDHSNSTGIRIKVEPDTDESLLKEPVSINRNASTQPRPTKPVSKPICGTKPAISVPTPNAQPLVASPPASSHSASKVTQKVRDTQPSNITPAQGEIKINAAKAVNKGSNSVQAPITRPRGQSSMAPANLDVMSVSDRATRENTADILASGPNSRLGVFKKARLRPRSPKRTFTSQDIDRPDKGVDWYNLRDQDYTKLHEEIELDVYPLTKGYKALTPLKYKYSPSELQGVQERFLDVYGYCTGDDYTKLVYRLNECRKAQLLLEISSYQELLDVKDRLKETRAGLEKALSQC